MAYGGLVDGRVGGVAGRTGGQATIQQSEIVACYYY